jgi:FkbM family methyltransferase
MSFISYAQNYEDVMLWRALKDVQHGFYIDVGASDPRLDSVTRAFYDRGWRGINVEPLKSHHQDLLEARPNDINLLCAAGPKQGQIDIWECEVKGWSTTAGDIIQKHKQDGHAGVFRKVPMFPLGDICEQYVQSDINFLKIDVEGFEEEVLRGMNFKKFRPWIVVIEATKPNSIEETHLAWEAFIVSNDYVFAYADGLNRFYVAKEQVPNILDALKYPPNVFDGYIRIQQYDSEIRAQQAEVKAQQAEAKAHQAEAKAQQAEAKAQQAEAKAQQAEAKAQQAEAKAQQAENDSQQFLTQLHRVYGSRSWRITAPLRWLYGQARRLRQDGLKARIQSFIKKVFRKINDELLLRPGLRQQLIGWFKILGLEELLKRLHAKAHGQLTHSNGLRSDQSALTRQLEILPPRAQQIYDDLKHAIDQQKQGGK